MLVGMEIRPATAGDLDRLIEIDGTIESAQYLHVERGGEGLAATWRLEPRPLRTKLIDRNAVDDDRKFSLRQVLGGVEEGIGLAAEHDGELAALGVAQLDPAGGVLRV